MPNNVIDEVAIQLRARRFMAEGAPTNPLNDLTAYAKAANAVVRYEALDVGESGYTMTRPDGRHIITVNSNEDAGRQRFTICHEIAHIILGLPSRHDQIPLWSLEKRDPNEIMCDIFAAELLLPHKAWLQAVPGDEPSVSVIQALAVRFDCSFHTAASRYASLATFPCALVTMDHGTIRHAARSTSLRAMSAWIAPRSSVPPESVAYQLRDRGESRTELGEVQQDAWFQDWSDSEVMNELARHSATTDSTISLLWFSEGHAPEREVDRFGKRFTDDGGLPELTGELPWPGRSKRK
ncbi:ImmA/IrrE family metallo-endopeptidase [Dyella sp.]|uniref:ImmA/IrrE family metallo-endopeptidase n=1 Tax=Dyella sp. TaxID=1869338 RepID=UPI002D79EE85|nr:ImmA/IrrE family metallo-endopeptidase [Dyella sp.]HET7332897.1 ImmA/IrrE family metallo-endopeptidase [Dyella sp.]